MKNTLRFLILLSAAACWAQSSLETILDIETDNVVNYGNDVPDYSKLATDPNRTNGSAARNFNTLLMIADIVAVNGKPAKGIWVQRGQTVNFATAPTPGQAIADIVRARAAEMIFEILQPDGTPVGTIFALGLGGGPAPPGAPAAAAGRHVLHLIPSQRPEIILTSDGPAAVHSSDFSLVTALKPARSGEILSLFVTGLGPTRPGVDPGRVFPASPLQAVNSPVEVMVNVKTAEVIGAAGYPGATDGYQVNFRMPSDMERGQAPVRVTSAWITGPEVKIAVQ